MAVDLIIVPDEELYLYVDGKNQGPYSLIQVRELFQEKRIDRATLLWYDGLANWISVGDIPEFDRREAARPPEITVAAEENGFWIYTGRDQSVASATFADIQHLITQKRFRRSDLIYDELSGNWVRADQFHKTRSLFHLPEQPGLGQRPHRLPRKAQGTTFGKRISYSKARLVQLSQTHEKLIQGAAHVEQSPDVEALFQDASTLEQVVRFVRTNQVELSRAVFEKKINWAVDPLKTFGNELKKLRYSSRTTLSALIYVLNEFKYFDFAEALDRFQGESLEGFLEEVALFELFYDEDRPFAFDHLKRYIEESKIRLPFFTSLSKKYGEARARIFRTFKSEGKGTSDASYKMNFEITAEQFGEIATKVGFDADLSSYVLEQTESMDEFYRVFLIFPLASAFRFQCCKCKESRADLEVDHFWIRKADGASLMIRRRDGRFFNNAIPLCPECKQSKGSRSALNFFSPEEFEEILRKSQTVNDRIHTRMIDFDLYPKSDKKKAA